MIYLEREARLVGIDTKTSGGLEYASEFLDASFNIES
jgi:hypothetical protein